MAGGTMGPFSMAVHSGTKFINSRPTGKIMGSNKYLWYDGDKLGDGATGTVFVGRKKTSGDLYAIKTFNESSRRRSSEVQMREFEMLSKLDHINIVKFFDMENEIGKNSRVLVMELCTGGSLYSILEHPANQFGLEESEFLLVLKHVTNGMKHLRDKGIIHRDLKPGNIMRFVTESGESIYKLVDFGAARELEDEEQFESLYGTEEYLYPDMYESAVLQHRHFSKRGFGAQCDLWSLGVTFYHAATGNLPFRPFGGRRNRLMMHHITTKKEPGVISGVQRRENGPVEWSRNLPSTCRLSLGLKALIRDLLAGMLEPDGAKMMKFDQFFEFVNYIVEIKPIHVFSVATGDFLRIYSGIGSHSPYSYPKGPYTAISSPDQPINDSMLSASSMLSLQSRVVANLQDAIAKQTDISANDQFLIFDGVSLDAGPIKRYDKDDDFSFSDAFADSISEGLLAKTQMDNPIFVLPKSVDVIQLANSVLPPWNDYVPEVDLHKDYQLAKQYCSVMYGYSRQMTRCVKVQKFLVIVQKIMARSIKSSVERIKNFSNNFKSKLDLISMSIHYAQTCHQTLFSIRDFSRVAQPQKNGTCDTLKQINSDFGNLEKHWRTFENLVARHIEVASNCCQVPPSTGGCNVDTPCTNTITAMIEETSCIMNDFKTDKKHGGQEGKELPFNTEQIHKYDKHNLNALREKACSQFKDHCYRRTLESHDYFKTWYSGALKYVSSVETQVSPAKIALEAMEIALTRNLDKFLVELSHVQNQFLKASTGNLQLKGDQRSDEEKMLRKASALMEKLAKDNERNNRVVGENNDLLQKMTDSLKGLEVVDSGAAGAYAIGGVDSDAAFYADGAGMLLSRRCHVFGRRDSDSVNRDQ